MDLLSQLDSSKESAASLRTETVSLMMVLLTFFVPDSVVQKASNVKNATSDAFKPSVVLEELIPGEATSRERDFFKAHEYLFKPSSRDTYVKSSKAAKNIWDKLPSLIQGILVFLTVFFIVVICIPLLYCIFTIIINPNELGKMVMLISINLLFLLFWIFYV